MIFHEQPEFTLHRGDCVEELRRIPDASVHTVCVDGPYGIRFMGKAWDGANISSESARRNRSLIGEKRLASGRTTSGFGENTEARKYSLARKDMMAFQEFTHAWAVEAYRILKPGGHLVSFCSTRTYHRMVCGIEDAGFEIRDQLAWVYGSGFPKSLDVSKAMDRAEGEEPKVIGSKKAGMGSGKTFGMLQAEGNNGYAPGVVAVTEAVTEAGRKWAGWGTALKPAWEPIVLARKPLEGTVSENLITHRTGALNIDGCRIAFASDSDKGATADKNQHGDFESGPMINQVYGKYDKPRENYDEQGRWPANIMHDGSPEIVRMFPADEGEDSAARFFKEVKPEEMDSLFCRAKALMETWNPSLAPTVEILSSQPEKAVASALSRAAIAASLGAKVLNEWKGLSTSVTPTRLRQIVETLIATILLLERKPWPAHWLDVPTLSGSLVRNAETNEQTGITTITISLLKSDGSAESATFSITLQNLELGEKGCARFNYCAKTSTEDREEGLEGFGRGQTMELPDKDWASTKNPYLTGGATIRANIHPTVKPTDLMRWLCRLVTPPGGRVLDCFTGSGSTGKACVLEGFHFTGIDLDEEGTYLPIAKARIAYALAHKDRWEQIHAAPKPAEDTAGQTHLAI